MFLLKKPVTLVTRGRNLPSRLRRRYAIGASNPRIGAPLANCYQAIFAWFDALLPLLIAAVVGAPSFLIFALYRHHKAKVEAGR